MTTTYMTKRTAGVAAGLMLAIALMSPLGAQQAPTGVCRVTGRITSGTTALPGVESLQTRGFVVKLNKLWRF